MLVKLGFLWFEMGCFGKSNTNPGTPNVCVSYQRKNSCFVGDRAGAEIINLAVLEKSQAGDRDTGLDLLHQQSDSHSLIAPGRILIYSFLKQMQ